MPTMLNCRNEVAPVLVAGLCICLRIGDLAYMHP